MKNLLDVRNHLMAYVTYLLPLQIFAVIDIAQRLAEIPSLV